MSLALGIRLFLATLFARAAWHKLSQSQVFQSELAAYKLVPIVLISPIAYVLAAAEIFCTLGLLFFSIAIQVTIVLLLIYATAIAINLWRGNTHIDCGCNGWFAPRKILSWVLVLRNLFLGFLSVICLLLPAPVHLSRSDLLLVLLIAFTLWILYETTEQTISNSQQYAQWKKSFPENIH